MTDIELRGIILQHLYDKRKVQQYTPQGTDFPIPIDQQDLVRICGQLKQHGLVDANIVDMLAGTKFMAACKISARGVDVIETGASPDLRIDLMASQTINISNSNNVVVGNHNHQVIDNSVKELVKLINSSSASPEQKEEAKNLLGQFLKHPLVTSIAGGVVGLLG